MRAAALIALLAAPAFADDPALTQLTPLVEVFDARKESPGYDVAGIRCAGLVIAQSRWVQDHPGTPDGPSGARKADVEDFLTRAEQHRRNAGQDLVSAYQSTLRDVERVAALFAERFAAAPGGRSPPWRGDRLVEGDRKYCDLLAGR